MSQAFQKNIEDFICEKCGTEVKGSGYTNHCPNCLWSKHVDINPGDRAEKCGGMMQPVNFFTERDGYALLHRCMKCGYEKKNKLSQEDDFDVAMKIIGKYSDV